MEKAKSNRLSACFTNLGDVDEQVDWEDFVIIQGKPILFLLIIPCRR